MVLPGVPTKMNIKKIKPDWEKIRAYAKEYAYCPYSNFHVGAEATFGASSPGDDEGEVTFLGANVENASYGLTICAERKAIFNGVPSGFKKLTKIVVSCVDAKPEDPPRFKTPCGACRQVIQEFAINDDIPVIIDGVGEFKLRELLPMGFKL